MKTSTLPGIAIWLLTQMAPGPNSDAITGDLAESSISGRSLWWLWRQVITAVTLNLLTDLRAIPLRAAVSVVTGWILGCVLMYGGMIAWGGLAIDDSNLHVHWKVYEAHYLLKCYVTLFLAFVAATAAVSTFDRKRRLALLSIWITFLLFWGCGWMIYFFQDPVRRLAFIQLNGFLMTLLGGLVGTLVSLNWIGSSEPKAIAPSNQ